MHEKRQKIIIVGAGPVGCYLAQLLTKAGIKPLLIEEHKEIGRPVHCAGLVGRKVFEDAQLPLPKDCVLNTINGAIIYIGKEIIPIHRKEVAYVIDREKFDKKLGKGLQINFESRFLGLEKENNHYLIETDRGSIEADIVIGADGARSAVREFVTEQHMDYLKGVQFRMKLKMAEPDMVEVYLKKPYFYWIIPERDNVVRIGVLSKNPYHDLLSFIQERKLSGEVLEKFAGIVPLAYFKPLVKDGIFLVGDSASQVKPLSYGGIYMGMRAAEILADCIINDENEKYSARWFKKFGKEIEVSLKARKVFSQLNDIDIEKLFSFIKKKTDIIEKSADFENHSLLLWEFLKYPSISREVLGILFKMVRTNFESVERL